MSDRLAKCLRCGAPGNAAVAGGRLVELRGFRSRRIGPTRGRRARHRVAYGYAHADPAFCATRMPGARRKPTDVKG